MEKEGNYLAGKFLTYMYSCILLTEIEAYLYIHNF
jgi:hypothetical protein